MDALELQKKLPGKIGDEESRDLLRFIEERSNLATRQDLEKLKDAIEKLIYKEIGGGKSGLESGEFPSSPGSGHCCSDQTPINCIR